MKYFRPIREIEKQLREVLRVLDNMPAPISKKSCLKKERMENNRRELEKELEETKKEKEEFEKRGPEEAWGWADERYVSYFPRSNF